MPEEKPSGKKQRKQRPRAHHGEGSVFELKDSKRTKRFVAQITLEDGTKKKTYHATEREAIAARRKMLNELEQGVIATGPQQKLKDYLEYWLEDVHRATIKVSTYALYRRNLDKHIIPHLGHIQLKKLTTDHVQAFCAKMSQEGLKPGTVRILHTILSGALDDAVQWKRITVNVCKTVKLPRYTKRKIHPLDEEQARRLVKAAQGSRLDCVIVLALTTALRLGEILALRWEDIDVEKRTLRVSHTVNYIHRQGWVEDEPKSESSNRSLTLPQVTVEALKQHRTHQLEARLKAGTRWKDMGLVFPNRDGEYFRRPRLYAIFKKLLQEAGLPNIRFHDLRHSAATILLSTGVPAKVVQEILGHANISTTMNIYGHVFPSTHGDAMDEMDHFFRQE